MAEEINQSQEVVEQPTAETISPSTQNVDYLDNALSSLETQKVTMPAKPASSDIYKYVVGNPLSGSNPGRENVSYLDAAVEKLGKTPQNDYSIMRPYSYSGDFDGANFERYYNSKPYKDLGFSPYRDNESLYNDNMTFGDEFVRAASQWPSLVWTGIKSGVSTWGDMFTDPLAPDVKNAREMQRAMEIGSSTKGGVGGFLTNTFLNSGYSIGIGLEMLAEDLALTAATVATGGLSSEVTLPSIFTRTGKAAEKIAEGLKVGDKITDTAKAAGKATDEFRAINNVSDARSFWNTRAGKITSGIGTMVNPLENTMQALKATDYATDYAKMVGTFGGFARDVMMTKAAVSEAKLEGGMTKIDVTEDLIKQYRDEHGVDPTGEELQKIENIANTQSYKTALYNMPAIMWSNKFFYNSMFAPVDKLLKKNLVKFSDDILFDKKTFVEAGEGFFNRAKVAAKALKDPKVYGRYAYNYLKGNFAEGIQENIQEAISKGSAEQAIAMYKDPARADYEGYMGYFMKGLSDQFSAQGAETFASGFAMSMFASPVMSAPSYAISKAVAFKDREKIKEAKAARDAQRKTEVDSLNDFYKNAVTYLAPDLANAVKQQKMADDLSEALENGDAKTARDIKDEAVFEHIHTALRTGKYDIILNKIKDYKNLSPEEAKDAFKEYGIEDGNQALKYIDKVISRAESIRNTYESVSNEMPNPFNFKQYDSNNPLFRANLIAYQAWEQAKKDLIFSKHSLTNLSERMEKMTQSFSGLANKIAKSDAQTFMSLMSNQGTIQEINTLKKEIAVLDESIPEQKKVKKQKTERLELIEKFYDTASKIKFGESSEVIEEAKKEAKKDFNKILKYLAGDNNSMVLDSTIDEAYQLVLDHMLLGEESKSLVKSINVLSNPEGFLSVQKRLQNVFGTIISDKENVLKYNNDVFTGRRELNIILNEIYKNTGLILKPEDLKAIKNAVVNGTEIPNITGFIDKNKEQDISPDDARYKVAMKVWEDHLDLLEKAEQVKREAKKSEATKEKQEGINPDDPSTYPQELIDKLVEDYEYKKSEGYIDPETSFQEWLTSDPTVRPIVNKYIKTQEKVKEVDVFADKTLDELKAEYDVLSKKKDLTEDEQNMLLNLENAIAIKELQAAMSPEQLAALKKLEAISKDAKKKDDQSGYVVAGEDYNLRATKLKDRILKEIYGIQEFNYAETSGKLLVEYYEKALKDISLKSKYKLEYAKNLINSIIDRLEKEKIKTYKDRLSQNKINKLIDAVSKDESVENFKKTLNDIIYSEAKDRGNVVDELARDFFDGKPIRKPKSVSEAAYRGIVDALTKVREKLKERGEIIVAKNVVPFGRYNVKGKEEKVAGELDLLVIDKDGNFKIYDIKTAGDWTKFGTEKDSFKKKEAYTLQLSIYKKMIEDLLGIQVKKLALLPIEVKGDLDGNILEAVDAFDAKNATITYDKVVEDYLQPIGKEVIETTPSPLPISTSTEAAIEEEPSEVTVSTLTFAQPVDTQAFNDMSIEEKFKALSSELQGDSALTGTFSIGDYGTYTDQSYQITLDDGRVVRVIPNYDLSKTTTVQPVGEKFAIKKITKEIEGKLREVLAIYRFDKDGNIKSQNFGYVRENTPSKEFKSETVTLESINKNINVDNLTIAKERGYEVLYTPFGQVTPNPYKISKINKKTVTLSSPISGDVTIKIEDLSTVIQGVVDPKSINVTTEDNDTILENKKSIVQNQTVYNNKLTKEEAKNNFINKLC